MLNEIRKSLETLIKNNYICQILYYKYFKTRNHYKTLTGRKIKVEKQEF